jgi:hypothetical protein
VKNDTYRAAVEQQKLKSTTASGFTKDEQRKIIDSLVDVGDQTAAAAAAQAEDRAERKRLEDAKNNEAAPPIPMLPSSVDAYLLAAFTTMMLTTTQYEWERHHLMSWYDWSQRGYSDDMVESFGTDAATDENEDVSGAAAAAAMPRSEVSRLPRVVCLGVDDWYVSEKGGFVAKPIARDADRSNPCNRSLIRALALWLWRVYHLHDAMVLKGKMLKLGMFWPDCPNKAKPVPPGQRSRSNVYKDIWKTQVPSSIADLGSFPNS